MLQLVFLDIGIAFGLYASIRKLEKNSIDKPNMRKLEDSELKSVVGGGILSNRTCSRIGIVVAIAAVAQRWGTVFGITGAAAAGGCFDAW